MNPIIQLVQDVHSTTMEDAQEITAMCIRECADRLNIPHDTITSIVSTETFYDKLQDIVFQDSWQFMFYDEETDQEHLLPLSPSVISCIKSHGYTLRSKLGQGATSAAFLSRNSNHKKVALLIPGNTCKHRLNKMMTRIRTLQENGELDTRYMIQIYSPILCYEKLSDDVRYCPHSYQGPVEIQVLELVDQTVAEQMIEYHTKSIEDKLKFVSKIKDDFSVILDYLDSTPYMYLDILPDNIGYIGDRMVLIDLDSLHPRRDNYDSTRFLYYFMKKIVGIYTEPTPDDIKSKSYKWVTGISSTKKERRLLTNLFIDS